MCNCKKEKPQSVFSPQPIPEPRPSIIITERPTTEVEQKLIDEFDNTDEFFNQ
jgi:hypothetical protein